MRIFMLLLIGVFAAIPALGTEIERVTFEGVKLRVLRVEVDDVSLVWRGEDEKPMRTFGKVLKHLEGKGMNPWALMNAGIFEPGGIPSGLHVENGELLRPINLKEGQGNFFLMPNGVLEWGDGKARILESKAWAKASREKLPAFALQSGPVLLLKGVIHPAFNHGSPNVKHRNGVGVDQKGRLVFAITNADQVINFHTFARLFRDQLGCRNALFLDGDISQLVVEPEEGAGSNRFGAVFVVKEGE